MERHPSLKLLLVPLFCWLPMGAEAATIIGNLPPQNDFVSTSISPTTFQKAVVFTMGSDSYNVDSITLTLTAFDTVNLGVIALVGIFQDDGTGLLPSIQVGNYFQSPVSSTSDSGSFTFLPTGTISLQAGTRYWLLVDSLSGEFIWNRSTPTSVTPSGDGAAFDFYRLSSDGGTAYSNSTSYNSFQINGTVVPEPGLASILILSALIPLRRSRPAIRS